MPSATELPESPVAAGSKVLRLLASEPSTAIVGHLAEGPLRSSRLMERLPTCSPRTVYRRLADLERLGAIARRRLAITPPAVAYELTAPVGEDLLRAVEGPVQGWLRYRKGIATEVHASVSLNLLAESWETSIFHELSCRERALTGLGEAVGLTHHQIGRRAKRLAAAGILDRNVGEDRMTRYSLSESARLGASVIAAVARWEADHVRGSKASLDLADVAALLASVLCLPCLPDRSGEVFALTVGREGENGATPRFASVWADVGDGGAVSCGFGPAPDPDGWAQGSVVAWLGALLDGKRGGLRVGGDAELIDAHLTRLHARLSGVA